MPSQALDTTAYWVSPPGCLTSTSNQHTQYCTHSFFSIHPICNNLEFPIFCFLLVSVSGSAVSILLDSPLISHINQSPLDSPSTTSPRATTLIKPSLPLSLELLKKSPQQDGKGISRDDGMFYILIGRWLIWVYAFVRTYQNI